MNRDYSKIRTIDELNDAIHEVRSQMKGKGGDIANGIYGLREAYKPANLLGMGVKTASSDSLPFDRYLLNGIRKVKSWFTK